MSVTSFVVVSGIGSQVGCDRPLLIFESEKFVGGPIDSVNFHSLSIAQCRDCKWEDSSWELALGLLDDSSFTVQWKTFLEVFSSKSSQDHDSLSIILGCTKSLTSLDRILIASLISDLQKFPLGLQVLYGMLDIKPLDDWHVAASLIWDSAEYVYEFVVEFTASVVVSSMVHLWEEWPLVACTIVKLTFPGRTLYLFACTCYNDVVVGKGAGCMTMTRNFHVSHWLTFEHFGLPVVSQLACFVHGLWRQIVVASSNHVHFWVFTYLGHLEVVG